jgi:hypothetical protein
MLNESDHCVHQFNDLLMGVIISEGGSEDKLTLAYK